ncbi:hypothetical protein [uncultured Tissierella sp.]|uniref:hypothetical protein n=1 Tax=uncultured Tissierella sp. TaxID=448160 RepID=UPI002804C960|nr:hypothetical protein [uncultured Tissierella sp.]MDU5080217.1 hypothetical protein [Bacillota bacterium]
MIEIINKKPLREIRDERADEKDIMLAEIYEILIDFDDRLTEIENKIDGGEK